MRQKRNRIKIATYEFVTSSVILDKKKHKKKIKTTDYGRNNSRIIEQMCKMLPAIDINGLGVKFNDN